MTSGPQDGPSFEELRRRLAARSRDDFPFERLDPAQLPEGGLRHAAVLVRSSRRTARSTCSSRSGGPISAATRGR